MFEIIGVVGLFLVLLGIAWCGEKLYWMARANLRDLVDTDDDLKEVGSAWEVKTQAEMSDEEFYARAQVESNLEKYKGQDLNTDTAFPLSEFPDKDILLDALKARDPHIAEIKAALTEYGRVPCWRITQKQQVGLFEVHAIQAAEAKAKKDAEFEEILLAKERFKKNEEDRAARELAYEASLTPEQKLARDEMRKVAEIRRAKGLDFEEKRRKEENEAHMHNLYANKEDVALLSCIKYFDKHLDKNNPHYIAALAEAERRIQAKKVKMSFVVDKDSFAETREKLKNLADKRRVGPEKAAAEPKDLGDTVDTMANVKKKPKAKSKKKPKAKSKKKSRA